LHHVELSPDFCVLVSSLHSMLRAGALIATCLHVAGALRRSRKDAKKIAGVPVINYRYRHLQSPALQEGPELAYDWVVKFKAGLGDDELASFCGGGPGAGQCVALGHPGHGGVPLATVRGTESKLRKLLEHHPWMVDFVEPDTSVELEPASTAEEAAGRVDELPWNLEKVNIAQARFTGRGVHVYVADSGIRCSHQEFGGRAVGAVDTLVNWGVATECDSSSQDSTCCADPIGHGTHVAGTAGGVFYGVAKEATIHAMKVFPGSGSNINAGLDWLARFAQKPAVMTMSLGSYSTPESSRVAVDAVVNSGVTVTVSAGNRASDSCLKSYTFIASAFGVGASTSTDTRAAFSNFGTCNAIFAPGVSIVSAHHQYDTESLTMSGTSMAAPLAAGATALLLEEDPSLTPTGVRNTLRERATKNALGDLLVGDPNLLLNVGISGPMVAPQSAAAPLQ